jgi:APA family basic amino acid/polyamine antiporter
VIEFFHRIFARTSLDTLRDTGEKSPLRKVLRARDLIAVGVGGMIGGGIFTTIGPGIKLAGPAIIASFLLAGLASFFAALCYAELGAMVPVAGSAYTYAYASLGQMTGWIVGFSLLFEYGVSVAPVAQQFSGALQGLLSSLRIALPDWARTSHFVYHGAWWNPAAWDLAHSQYDVIAALFVLVLSGLLAVGIRETATANNIFVVLKLAALAVFVLAGLALFHPQNLTPFAPFGWGSLQPFSGGNGNGIIPAAALVFFSYIGFDSVTVTSEECRRPQRDIPVGILGTLALGTIVYCVVAIVLLGDVPWQKVDVNDALAKAVAPLHNPLVDWTIGLGILCGTTTVGINGLLGQTRIFYVMARDKMLPPAVAHVDPRFKTPLRTTLLIGAVVAILALIVPLDVLLDLVNIGTLTAFAVVCAAVIRLRGLRPDLPRPFKVPFSPVFPLLGVISCAFLAIYGLTTLTWIRFVISLVVGLVIYFGYGYRVARPERDAKG